MGFMAEVISCMVESWQRKRGWNMGLPYTANILSRKNFMVFEVHRYKKLAHPPIFSYSKYLQ